MPNVSFHRPLTRVRILAFLLLASLAWGAIAEVTHRHNGQKISRSRQSLSAPIANSQAGAGTELGSSERQTFKSSISSQCTLCQLQQNLSATLFGPTLQLAAPDSLSVSFAVQKISTLSSSALIPDGRAPPVNSLS
jgi:hypothetical protein